MTISEPVLTTRIPSLPFGDPRDRHLVRYEEYVASGGYETLRKALEMDTESIIHEVKESQLRGRGGAGFPCGLKWTFLPKDYEGRRYLTVNADESEPATFKDRLLIDYDPHQLLEGIAITCYACKIQVAYIYIRGEYHKQAKTLERAIKEAYDNKIFGSQGLLGNSKWAVECYVHRGAGAYVCGEETGLLESIEGKRGWPRIKPPFPAVEGLFGKPTIINNVETISYVPHIVKRGAEWFKSLGVESSIGGPPSYGTKLMGVSGHVEKRGVYELELGIKLSDLVEKYCGGIRDGKKFKAALPGGVSMGVLGTDQFDAEMDFDIGRKYQVLGLGTACPTIFDEDTSMVMVAKNISRFFRHESCGQCTPCREGSAWLNKLVTRIADGNGYSKDLDLVLEIASSMGAMPGTTICGLADGNNWAMRTIINKFRDEFEAIVKPSLVPVTVELSS